MDAMQATATPDLGAADHHPADHAGAQHAAGQTPADLDAGPAVRPPRPWLPPLVVGIVVAVASVGWWLSIYETPPCRVGTVGFGLLALLAFGVVATVGVWFALDSQTVVPRRRGKALLVGALAAMTVFLVLTTVLSWVIPLVLPAC